MANQTSNENKSCPDCGRRIAIYKGHIVACQCTYAERDTDYKTLDEIEALLDEHKARYGSWSVDRERDQLAAALRSAVGMVREMEKSEAWLGEMNRKMERERDEARAERRRAWDALRRLDTIYRADIDTDGPYGDRPAWLLEALHDADKHDNLTQTRGGDRG
jgi:hypothetical protein